MHLMEESMAAFRQSNIGKNTRNEFFSTNDGSAAKDKNEDLDERAADSPQQSPI